MFVVEQNSLGQLKSTSHSLTVLTYSNSDSWTGGYLLSKFMTAYIYTLNNYVNQSMWNTEKFLHYLYISMFTCPVGIVKLSEYLLEAATNIQNIIACWKFEVKGPTEIYFSFLFKWMYKTAARHTWNTYKAVPLKLAQAFHLLRLHYTYAK